MFVRVRFCVHEPDRRGLRVESSRHTQVIRRAWGIIGPRSFPEEEPDDSPTGRLGVATFRMLRRYERGWSRESKAFKRSIIDIVTFRPPAIRDVSDPPYDRHDRFDRNPNHRNHLQRAFGTAVAIREAVLGSGRRRTCGEFKRPSHTASLASISSGSSDARRLHSPSAVTPFASLGTRGWEPKRPRCALSRLHPEKRQNR